MSNKPLSIALVGLGGAAERIHLPALKNLPEFRLVAGVDPDPDRRIWASREGFPTVYDRPDEMISAVKPDVVLIGTPPSSHKDIALMALDAGAHVFCEKPFVQSVAEADEIIAASKSAGRVVVVNNQYRQMLIYRRTRAAIARGLFGRPYMLQVWQQMNLSPDHDPPWRAALSKRILFEFATHAIDLVSFLFGADAGTALEPGQLPDQPVSVSAKTPYVTADQKADLICLVRLDLPGDRIANLVFNRRSMAPQRYLEMRLDCEDASLRISLGGVARWELGWSTEQNRPRIRTSFVRGGEVRVERNGKSRILAREPAVPFSPATGAHLQQFARAIENGARPEGSATMARELIRTVFAAYDSAEMDGKLVTIHRPALD